MSQYTNVSIKKELADSVKIFIKANTGFGFRSIAQFVEYAVRKRLEDLKVIGPDILPRLEKINVDEDGVKIFDRDLHEVIQVFFKPKGILCGYCETPDCLHVEFALTDAEVKEQIRKKRLEGWKLPEV